MLHERPLRKALSNMYAAFVGSVDNSKAIMETMPGDIEEDSYAGHEHTRLSMKKLCEWLHSISMLTKDAKSYDDAFLDPIRAVAGMRLTLSRNQPSTTTIEALVFAKTSYFDRMFKSERTVLSVIAPGLQAPMTVRVSVGAESVRYGYHAFENCQPMPLVNRIHQTAGKMSPSGRAVILAEFDYLYTALADIQRLKKSLEMECFCEVPSSDAGKRRRLAAPFVTFGIVQMVRGRFVYMQSLDGTTTTRMAAAEQFAELSGAAPCDFEGRTVRLLGAQWYESGRDQDDDPEDPAVYAMEVDKASILRVQEECGRVRLRGNISLTSVPATARGDLLSLRCISRAGSTASYSYRVPEDEIMGHFVKAHSRIRAQRSGARINAVQMTEEQVIDRRKSGIRGLVALATSKKHASLSRVILDRIMQGDMRGEYSAEAAAKSLHMRPDHYSRHLSFLRHLGVVEKGDGSWPVTKKGRRVAEGISLEMASRISQTGMPQVMHPDVLAERGIPPSLALGLLRSQSLGKYARATIDGRATDIYWEKAQEGAAKSGRAAGQYESLKAAVLAAMGSVAHPLAVPKIAEMIRAGGGRASALVIGMMLSDLAGSGERPVKPDGDTWVYTTAARVRTLFEKDRDAILSVDDMVARTMVGVVRRDEVSEAVGDLVSGGFLMKLGNVFTHNSKIESKVEALARADTRRKIVGMLSSCNAMDDDDLIAAVAGALDAAGDTRDAIDKAAHVRGVLNKMEADGKIWFNGRMVGRVV